MSKLWKRKFFALLLAVLMILQSVSSVIAIEAETESIIDEQETAVSELSDEDEAVESEESETNVTESSEEEESSVEESKVPEKEQSSKHDESSDKEDKPADPVIKVPEKEADVVKAGQEYDLADKTVFRNISVAMTYRIDNVDRDQAWVDDQMASDKDWYIPKGTKVTVKINYVPAANRTFEEGDKIIYNLPTSIKVDEKTENLKGEVISGADVAGQYVIGMTDGKWRFNITLDTNFLEAVEGKLDKGYLTYSGTLNYTPTTERTQKIEFPGGIEIDIPTEKVVVSEVANLDVFKDVVPATAVDGTTKSVDIRYDSTNGYYVVYQIKVVADPNNTKTIDAITVDDILSEGQQFFKKAQGKTYPDFFDVTPNDGSFAPAGSTWVWNIGSMAPGTTKILTYKAKLENSIINEGTSYNPAGNTVKNTAVLKKNGNEVKRDDASATSKAAIQIKKSTSGFAIDSNNVGWITYTVKVTAPKDNERNLKNVTVKDIFSDDNKKFINDYTVISTTKGSASGDKNKKELNWTSIGDMVPGQEETLTYKVKVSNDILFDANNTGKTIAREIGNTAEAYVNGTKGADSQCKVQVNKTWLWKNGKLLDTGRVEFYIHANEPQPVKDTTNNKEIGLSPIVSGEFDIKDTLGKGWEYCDIDGETDGFIYIYCFKEKKDSFLEKGDFHSGIVNTKPAMIIRIPFSSVVSTSDGKKTWSWKNTEVSKAQYVENPSTADVTKISSWNTTTDTTKFQGYMYDIEYYAKRTPDNAGNSISNGVGITIGYGGNRYEHNTEWSSTAKTSVAVAKAAKKVETTNGITVATWENKIEQHICANTTIVDERITSSGSNGDFTVLENTIAIKQGDYNFILGEDYTVVKNANNKFTVTFKKGRTASKDNPIVITYQTTLNTSGMNASDKKNYTNKVTIAEPGIGTATSQASTTYTKEQTISKSAGATFVENGKVIIPWTIRINQNGTLNGDVTVIDELPEGLEYVRFERTLGAGAAGTGVSVSNEGRKVTINYTNIPKHFDGIESDKVDNAYIDVKLYTRVVDESFYQSNNKEYKFSNEAYFDGEGGKHSNKPEAKIRNELLGKSGKYTAPYREYTVVVNKNGLDLTEDKTILVKDIMSTNMMFLVDTFKIYEVVNGKDVLLTGYKPVPFTSAEGNGFTIDIPDDKTIKFVYRCYVTGEIHSNVQVTNKVAIEAFKTSYQPEEAKFEIKEASAGVDSVLVKVQKFDKYTSDPLPGAEFTLYTVKADGSLDESTAVTKTTNNKGQATFNELSESTVYAVKETKVPDGYRLDDQITYFAFKENAITSNLVDKNVKVVGRGAPLQFLNEKGTVIIKKEFGLSKPDGTYYFALFDTKGERKSDIQSIVVENGTVANDTITYNNVEFGTYRVCETKQDGTALEENESINSAVFDIQGQDPFTITAENHTKNVVIKNTRKGQISVLKVDALEKAAKKLNGAEFTIYADEDCTTEIETITTANDGTAISKYLPLGTYYVKETKAPRGYKLDSTKYTVIIGEDTFTNKNGVEKIKSATADDDYVTNEETKVPVRKVDITETNKVLTGAQMQVLDAAGIMVDSWTSAQTDHVIKGLVTGEVYTLHEVYPPEHYSLTKDTTFKLNADGSIDTQASTTAAVAGVLLVKDTILKFNVTKKDLTDGEEVPGAKITIYELVTDEETGETSKGKVVDEWTSSEKDPSHDFGPKLIVEHKYVLEETVAPEGFEYITDTPFELDKDGKIKLTYTAEDGTHSQVVVGEDNEVLVEDAPIHFNVTKKDLTGDEELPGATFTIYTVGEDGAKGVEVVSWTSSKREPSKDFGEYLNAGHTYIMEETVAPKGYEYIDPVTFTVDKAGKVVVTDTVAAEDKVTSSVVEKTGDENAYVVKDAPIHFNVTKKDLTGDEELPGATITIYTVGEDGAKGVEVVSWTSSERERSKDFGEYLNAGNTYVMEETVAPTGHEYITDTYFTVNKDGSVELTYEADDANDSLVERADGDNSFLVKDAPVNFNLNKVDFNGNYVFGAVFTIYDEEGKVVDTWKTSEEEPNHNFGDKLDAGKTYTLEESFAPAGYEYMATTEFTVNKDGTITYTYEPGNTHSTLEEIEPEIAPNALEEDPEGEDPEKEDPEDKEPVDEPDELITVGENDFVVKNAPIVFHVTKKDITGEKEVPGAVITIYEEITADVTDEEGNVITDEEGNLVTETQRTVIATWTSSEEEPSHDFGSKLEGGHDYILEETVAPTGHEYITDTPFHVNEDGTVELDYVKDEDSDSDSTVVRVEEEENHFLIEDAPINFNVNKTDITGQEELEGAVLTIYTTEIDEEGNIVKGEALKDENGEIVSWTSVADDYVDFGKYLDGDNTYVLEETVAPLGHGHVDDIFFYVGKDGKIDTDLPTNADAENGEPIFLVMDTLTEASIIKISEETEEPIKGAKLIIIDEDGNRVAEWTTDGKPYVITGVLNCDQTYTLIELEAPKGFEVAPAQEFELSYNGTIELVMSDPTKEDEGVSITVEKSLVLSDGTDIAAKDATFLVALYDDQELTNRISNIEEIHFVDASTSSVTFEGLETGREYYVGECDENGIAFAAATTEDGINFFVDRDDAPVVVRREGDTTIYEFQNEFIKLPDGYYPDGKLKITKELVDKDGKAIDSDETFYVGIFEDEACTKLHEQANTQIVALDLAGTNTATVTVFTHLPEEGEDYTFYIAEVEKVNGKYVPVGETFEYDVTIDKNEVSLGIGHNKASITVTNAEKKPHKPHKNVKTGDNSNLTAWIIAMITALAGMIFMTIRRKRTA